VAHSPLEVPGVVEVELEREVTLRTDALHVTTELRLEPLLHHVEVLTHSHLSFPQ
jgi:hypothetical protein